MPVSDKDEEDLLGSLDDSSRFTPVFERHIFEIHRYLSFRVGSDLADDLTAETFLQAFKGRVNYDPSRRSVSAWLFCSATNLVRHHRRDEQRCLRLDCKAALGEPAFPLGEDFSEQIATRSELSEVIADLDRNTRDVVPVVAGAGLTYAETAVALAIPVGTVRSRLSRARIRARFEWARGLTRSRRESDSDDGARSWTEVRFSS
jgi:RNA polymerase sigma factor (sigma-70 family)